MTPSFPMPPPEAFTELPGMRGLRIARVGQGDGKTLEVIEGVKGVVIPAVTHPGSEKGRVIEGSFRFMKDGEGKTLSAGDTWEVAPGETQGPHVFLDDARVVVLRDGESAYDA